MATKIAEKRSYWGHLFQRFEDTKDAQEGVSEKTIEIYENTRKFFSSAFDEDHDPFQAPPTSQKDKEKPIFDGLQAVIVARKRSKSTRTPGNFSHRHSMKTTIHSKRRPHRRRTKRSPSLTGSRPL